MSWQTQLQEICGADAVSRRTPEHLQGSGASETLWVDVASEEQLHDVVLLAARERRRLLPAGAGEHLSVAAVEAADAVVSLRRMTRVVHDEPEDLTMVVQSGVPLRDLDDLLARRQQELAVDCWRGRAATVGGAVAANRSGLYRLVHGTWRDQVLGARVLHVDGSTSRTGSRVVKSVSGYDLAKLYVGSRGSLGFVLEVNLRVLCAPRTSHTLRCAVAAESLIETLQAVHDHPSLQPAAILLMAEAGEARQPNVLDVMVRFRGRPGVVERQSHICLELLGGEILSPDAATQLAQRLRQQLQPAAGRAQLRLAVLPVAVAPLAVRWAMQLRQESGFVAQFGVGTASLRLGHEDALEMQHFLRDTLVQPAHFEWEACPHDWLDMPPRSSPSAATLHEAVRASFDPDGILVPQALPVVPRGGSA